jgi:hypothetical protein
MGGFYTYSVSDGNGCSTATLISIAQPPALTVHAAATPILCNGDLSTVSVSASGGTPTYTYTGNYVRPAGSYTFMAGDANGCVSATTLTISEPPVLTVNVAASGILCNGGISTVTVSASGGTPTYSGTGTYSLSAGSASYSVTDTNGCIASSSVNVSEPSLLVTNVAGTNVLCNGGTASATINASGGTGAYTYTWSSGATSSVAMNLAAGTYTAKVSDANNCSSVRSLTISQPGALTANTSTSIINCNGGTGNATVSATGGSGTYTYSWSTGATGPVVQGLSAGAYTATVNDANNCSVSRTITLTEPALLTASTSGSPILCAGGISQVTVIATGGTPSYTGTGTFTMSAGTQTYTVSDSQGCTTTTSISLTQPPALSLTVISSPVLCNGEISTVSVSANGGVPSYSGTGTFTTLAGISSYSVNDSNGCQTSATFTITEPSALNASVSVSPVLCNGGSATINLTATGGVPGYSGTGMFTVTAGTTTYTLADANGCQVSNSLIISEPPVLTMSASASAILCNGGLSTVTVSAAGGTSSYTGTGTYTMNAGTDIFTVTDSNGCSETASISVTEPGALSVNITASPIYCHGGTASTTVTASGGTPLYNGTGTFTATAGSVTYTITDTNGCEATASVAITEPAAIGSNQNISLCAGQSFTMGGNTYSVSGTYTLVLPSANGCDSTITTVLIVNAPVNTSVAVSGNILGADAIASDYQWIDCNNGFSPLAGEKNKAFTAGIPGNYAVVITQNGCTDTSACYPVLLTGLKGYEMKHAVRVSPNPGAGVFHVHMDEDMLQVTVTDMMGRVIQEITPVNRSAQFDLSGATNGVYFVKITGNKSYSLQKIILAK